MTQTMSTVLIDTMREEALEVEQGDPTLALSEATAFVGASQRQQIIERAAARGIAQPEGTVLLQIIRPGVGGGRGRRYYGPDLLEADAPNWKGTRMFKNHETDAERRAREMLPRKVEDLGGRIVESWWDPDVPAEGRFERGGTYGFVRPVKLIRDLIDVDPHLVEASIAAFATSIRPGRKNGQSCTIVEGVRQKPRAVDWIAGEGGAGGLVLSEAAEEEAVLDSMSDQEFEQHLRRERPELVALLEAAGHANSEQEDTAVEITAEVLREALATQDGKAIIAEIVAEGREHEAPEGYVKADEVTSLVEAAMGERADLIRLETAQNFTRQIELRDMKDKAHALVEAAHLHPTLSERIKGQFRLDDNGVPSDSLNIGADYDDSGNVVKSPMAKLEEAVTEEIEGAKSLMSDLRRSSVSGQGGRRERVLALRESATQKDENGDPIEPKTTGSHRADEVLLKAGFSPDKLSTMWDH